MLAEKNPYINRAYQQLQIISQDKEKRLEYEAREKAIFDHNQLILEAKESIIWKLENSELKLLPGFTYEFLLPNKQKKAIQ